MFVCSTITSLISCKILVRYAQFFCISKNILMKNFSSTTRIILIIIIVNGVIVTLFFFPLPSSTVFFPFSSDGLGIAYFSTDIFHLILALSFDLCHHYLFLVHSRAYAIRTFPSTVLILRDFQMIAIDLWFVFLSVVTDIVILTNTHTQFNLLPNVNFVEKNINT